MTTYWYVKSLHNNKLYDHKTQGGKEQGQVRRPFKIKIWNEACGYSETLQYLLHLRLCSSLLVQSMEAVGLGLPAWLDRGSDLGAAVSLLVQLRTSRLGQGKHASHWSDTCMLISSCRPPGDTDGSDWSAAKANGVVTGNAKQREKRQI